MTSKRSKALQPQKDRWQILTHVRMNWHPAPVLQPLAPRNLAELPAIERAAEVIGFTVLQCEHWLSPGGFLREWLRWNLVVSILLSMPALLIVPVVTWLLGQFATWAELLAQILRHLLVFPLAAVVVIAVLSAVLIVLRTSLLLVKR